MGQISAKEIKEIEFFDIQEGRVKRADSIGIHVFRDTSPLFNQIIDFTDGISPLYPKLNNQEHTTVFIERIQNISTSTVVSYMSNAAKVAFYRTNNTRINLLTPLYEGLKDSGNLPSVTTRGFMIYMEY